MKIEEDKEAKRRKKVLKKDSRYRIRHMMSKEADSEESELENNRDICILLLQYVTFVKPKKKANFSDFYSVLNDCKREAKKKLLPDLL